MDNRLFYIRSNLDKTEREYSNEKSNYIQEKYFIDRNLILFHETVNDILSFFNIHNDDYDDNNELPELVDSFSDSDNENSNYCKS
jgi:hypothetical protein